MAEIFKYPKTFHLEGSGLSTQTKDKVSLRDLATRHLVVEEKVDGTNVGISFSDRGELLLQSRGHFLTGGDQERHFSLFKQWANSLITELYLVLSDRYILYGEWLYAKHTIFYNALPDYFLEYDVLDTHTRQFLDTPSRRSLLNSLPIFSVPVLFAGKLSHPRDIVSFLGASQFIESGHLEMLQSLCRTGKLSGARAIAETDPTTMMEGLYVKVEETGSVIKRYKYIREAFIQKILSSGGHWQNRAVIPNQLRK